MSERSYIAIDLKSFYASVECVERNLDPLNTNLVVADESRTEKTICLAVTPSLKAHGISGRARLFEVIQAVTTVNMLKGTGRMLNIFGVKIRKAEDGTEVTVESEASELDKRLLPGTKIAVLGYHTDKDEEVEPADRIVAKTLNY